MDFAIRGGHRDAAEVLLEHMHKLQIAGIKNALPSESEFEEGLCFVQEKTEDPSLPQEKRDNFEGLKKVLEKFKVFALPSSDESDNSSDSESSD